MMGWQSKLDQVAQEFDQNSIDQDIGFYQV
jgi:hypothetical protein